MSNGSSKSESERPSKQHPELLVALWMIGPIIVMVGLSLLLRYLGYL